MNGRTEQENEQSEQNNKTTKQQQNERMKEREEKKKKNYEEVTPSNPNKITTPLKSTRIQLAQKFNLQNLKIFSNCIATQIIVKCFHFSSGRLLRK